MTTKDPYLSELDALDELAPEEESTDIRIDNPPPEAESPAEPSDSLVDRNLAAQDVPVQLVVVMSRKGISMKELLELRSGQVIDFDKSPTEAVDLVVGGKVVAKGELVEIDGKLGVRVLKLLK